MRDAHPSAGADGTARKASVLEYSMCNADNYFHDMRGFGLNWHVC
jgi:hypothetical protein